MIWLADLLGIKCITKRGCIMMVRAMIREKINLTRRNKQAEAKINQTWEDIQFRERYFIVKRDELHKAQDFEKRTGRQFPGFFGFKFYPPYTIWDFSTAKYIDRTVADKEWQEAVVSNLI